MKVGVAAKAQVVDLLLAGSFSWCGQLVGGVHHIHPSKLLLLYRLRSQDFLEFNVILGKDKGHRNQSYDLNEYLNE